MVNSVDLVGNLATICTIGLFLTGSQICYKIHVNKTVGDISSLPFVTGFLNCIFWFFYGFLKNNLQIIIVNAVGFNLQAVYMLIYLYYSQNKKKSFHQILFMVILSACVYIYAFVIETDIEKAATVLGFISSAFAVLMFGSPLSSLRIVMRDKSTESLSFSLCLANFIVATEWTIYGILLGDQFIKIPNLLGAILGFAQVSLFFKFPSQSLSSRSKKASNQTISS